MDIRHLKIFIAVAETGKMSTAAAKLFVSQPTVSQTIRELEEHYNVLLFERLCRKLHITAEGKKLLAYAKKVIKQFDDLEEKMDSITDIDKVKIGATITIGSCLISDIVSRIKEKHTNIEPYGYINNTDMVEKRILNSELDIAIIEGEIKSSNIISIPEIEDYLVLVCGNDHQFADREYVELVELTDMDFVMREKGSGTRELFENYMYDNGFDVRTRWETSCPEAMKTAVIRNGCLAVLSIRLVEQEIKDGRIKVIKHAENVWNRNFSIVYHKDKVLDESMIKVIEIIREFKDLSILDNIEAGKLVNTCKVIDD